MEKRGLHDLLGREAMWLLSSCNYLNIPWGLFWGHSSLGSSSYHCFTCSYSCMTTPFPLFIFGEPHSCYIRILLVWVWIWMAVWGCLGVKLGDCSSPNSSSCPFPRVLLPLHSLLLVRVLLGWAWKWMVGRGDPSLNGCNNLAIIPRGNRFPRAWTWWQCRWNFPQLRVIGVSSREISWPVALDP